MKPPPFFFLLLLITTSITTASAANATKTLPPTPAPTSSPTSPTPVASSNPSPLDPKQIRALQSLDIPTKNACALYKCDSSKPFSHLLSLRLSNCSDDVSLSSTALRSLSTIQNLTFFNCPVAPIHFPTDLSLSLRSFSCGNSLRHLTGVSLSRFVNLTDLTITNVPVTARGLYVILGNMHKLKSVTISDANVSGTIPKHLPSNLNRVDFSGNHLKGNIPTSITLLENLEHLNLSSNGLNGEIPSSIGDLISLKNVSLASNSLSGMIPESMASLTDMVHLDLSSNQLNGTIPKFFSDLKNLSYLNLQNNNFHGVLPFNASILKKLQVLKVAGNSNLCYNHTVLSSKSKLGIAPCNKHGLPMSPPPAKDESSADSESDSSDYNDGDDDDSSQKEHHHGPNKVVLGLAIGLSSIVFLIVFVILLSKWCG